MAPRPSQTLRVPPIKPRRAKHKFLSNIRATITFKILQLSASVFALAALSASAAIRYVDVNSASPTPPYTNWATAATTIQDAVDTAVASDQIVVTNGVYRTGQRFVVYPEGGPNRVAVTNKVMIRSVNGAAVTVIDGGGEVRCAHLGIGAALVGFTLSNGVGDNGGGYYFFGGGGVHCESASAVVSNCVLTGNSASHGGGVSGGTLNNCTLTANSASVGGGAYGGTLNNCVVYYNNARSGDNYSGSLFSY